MSFDEIILPVFIEPVIDLGFGIKRIAEIGWSGGGHPELWLLVYEQVIDQLLILSLVVVLNDTEVSCLLTYRLQINI